MPRKASEEASAVLHDILVRGLKKRKKFSITEIGISSCDDLVRTLPVLIYKWALQLNGERRLPEKTGINCWKANY